MPMNTDDERLLREVLERPIEARAAIAARLLETLDADVNPDAEAAWSAEIAKRIATVDSGAARIPWAEARARILDASRKR